jgi:DNA-binding GntR family transcriptional regulator/predicted metal-dependent enzyme (double-stranded beta helix superfamily)
MSRRAKAKSGERLSDIAFHRIKRDIVSSVLGPGTELTEGGLAQRCKLGKGPVRAALLRLCQEGWVRAIPRKGYVIAPVTVRDVQSIFQLRQLLEPAVMRLAAGQVEGDRLKRLDAACTARSSSSNFHLSTNLRANRMFHTIVAHACGNDRLGGIIEKLQDQLERLLQLGLSSWDRNVDLPLGHGPLIEALLAGDGEAAARISAAEIETTRKIVMNAITSHAGPLQVQFAGGMRWESMTLNEFVNEITEIVQKDNASEIPVKVAEKMPRLLANPSLLTAEQMVSLKDAYRQYLLYLHPEGCFSILALIREAGHSSPIHDHNCWGVVGVYQGEEREQRYLAVDGPEDNYRLIPSGVTHHRRGDVSYFDPFSPNTHCVDNPSRETAISIHVYGSDIRELGASIRRCYSLDGRGRPEAHP